VVEVCASHPKCGTPDRACLDKGYSARADHVAAAAAAAAAADDDGDDDVWFPSAEMRLLTRCCDRSRGAGSEV